MFDFHDFSSELSVTLAVFGCERKHERDAESLQTSQARAEVWLRIPVTKKERNLRLMHSHATAIRSWLKLLNSILAWHTKGGEEKATSPIMTQTNKLQVSHDFWIAGSVSFCVSPAEMSRILASHQASPCPEQVQSPRDSSSSLGHQIGRGANMGLGQPASMV